MGQSAVGTSSAEGTYLPDVKCGSYRWWCAVSKDMEMEMNRVKGRFLKWWNDNTKKCKQYRNV